MSYTPTEWATGDVITAEKLNNMESGIAGAGSTFMVTVTGDPRTQLTLNKTCGEIKAATMNGSLICFELFETQGGETACGQTLAQSLVFNEGGGCAIELYGDVLTAQTDNDYPSIVHE